MPIWVELVLLSPVAITGSLLIWFFVEDGDE